MINSLEVDTLSDGRSSARINPSLDSIIFKIKRVPLQRKV